MSAANTTQHPELQPMRVHSEAHRLISALEDSMLNLMQTDEDRGQPYLDAYAAHSQRRKELHEWIAKNTPAPTPLYTVFLKF